MTGDKRISATRVRAGALHAALKDVTAVVQGRNTIPILDHVLIGAGELTGQIDLTASNLDMWVTRTLASNDRGEPDSAEWAAGIKPFVAALPAKALLALAGEIDPDAMLEIEVADGRAVLRAGRARFRLSTLPAGDFPLPPVVPVHAGFEMACSALADSLAAVEHAMSSEETRYYLNGIYLHPDGLSLKLAATDGHRLARLAFDAPDGAVSFPPCIVARLTVAVLDRLCAAAVKAAGEGAPPQVLIETASEAPGALVRFEMPAADGGSVEVVAKTIDGSFPDYARVIPASTSARAVIDREAFSAAIKRVAVLGAAKSRAVRCAFGPGILTLTVTSAELGEACEELPCDWTATAGGEAEPLTIGFDTRYLREALGAIASDQVALRMSDPGAPALIRAVTGADGSECERLVQVLMPVSVFGG